MTTTGVMTSPQALSLHDFPRWKEPVHCYSQHGVSTTPMCSVTTSYTHKDETWNGRSFSAAARATVECWPKPSTA